MRFTKFEVVVGSTSGNSVVLGSPAQFKLHYKGKPPLRNVEVALGIYNSRGEKVIWVSNFASKGLFVEIPESGVISIFFEKFPLAAGTYTINLYCEVSKTTADWVQSAAEIDVIPGDYYGSGKIPASASTQVFVPNSWDFSA